MQFFQVATVFVSWCLLHFRASGGRTTFTEEPPGTVFGNLGSDVTFHWKFEFGNDQDWNDFDEIFWGTTDNNNKIRNKYITVFKNGKTLKNRELSDSLQSRVGVAGNISKHGCNLTFELRNVTRADERITYGCTAKIYGNWYRRGPVILVIQG